MLTMSDVILNKLLKNKIFIAICLYILSNCLGSMLYLWLNPSYVRHGLGLLECFIGASFGQFFLLLGVSGVFVWFFCLIPLALLILFFKFKKWYFALFYMFSNTFFAIGGVDMYLSAMSV